MKITDFINQLNTVMRVEGNIHIVPFCVTFQNEEMSEIFDSLSQRSPAPPLTENEVDTIVTSVFTELNDQVHELVSDSLVEQFAHRDSALNFDETTKQIRSQDENY